MNGELPCVTVLLLNWNGLAHLQRFLPSVAATDYPNLDLLLVDNHSTDDSVAWVNANFPQVRTVVLDQNYGFAQGNNLGLQHAVSPYVVLLNTDVETPPDWLRPLVELAESDPTIAAIQPKIRAIHDRDSFEYAGASGGFVDTLAYAFCRGRVFDTLEKDTGQYDQPRSVFWATGACLFLRRKAVEEIGLFDPKFFAHWEEIDFCWRAQNNGYKLMVEPLSVVYHVGGGTLPKSNPRKTFLNFRNSLMAMYKNMPLSEALPKIMLRLILDDIEISRSLPKGKFDHAWAIVRAHFAFYALVPYCNRQRSGLKRQPLNQLAGVYKRSLVFDYFLGGKKRFSDLKMD